MEKVSLFLNILDIRTHAHTTPRANLALYPIAYFGEFERPMCHGCWQIQSIIGTKYGRYYVWQVLSVAGTKRGRY